MRLMFLILGWLALVLGLIGLALPVMPTTPFLIVAAFAFGRGSPKMRAWLVNHAHLGPPIRHWEEHGAIARPVKWLACTMMAGSLGLALLLGLPPLVLAVQALCLGGAALFVVTRPD